jgi:site-specific DNA-cytosine methylase
MTLNVLDLFCGCGGMSKGLVDAGLNIIAGMQLVAKYIININKVYIYFIDLYHVFLNIYVVH